jgi:hypothetical protein
VLDGTQQTFGDSLHLLGIVVFNHQFVQFGQWLVNGKIRISNGIYVKQYKIKRK